MRRSLPLLAAALVTTALGAGPASAAADDEAFARWTTTNDFAQGTSTGLSAPKGAVTLGKGTTSTTFDDPRVGGGSTKYHRGTWTSPWRATGFGATSLVPSWSITTPSGTWARVDVRVKNGSKTGSWDTVARYASGTSKVKRASYSAQTDDLAWLSTDTLIATRGTTFTSWQVRVLLMRAYGTGSSPTLHSVGGVAATYLTRSRGTSSTTMTSTKDLKVPMASQMIHKGEFPQWGGGGEAWCSPTSTAMVMRYFDRSPTSSDYSWAKVTDGWVDHAARYTYDHTYEGTGNWPFNTAYASSHSLDAFVTRLRSLQDAETFIKAGIPLVVSVAFKAGALDGSPISSTPGHLMVVRGFTSAGNVIVNDPAAPKNSSVRRVYQRSQLEKAWLGGSGGVAYVMRPTSVDLPKDTPRW